MQASYSRSASVGKDWIRIRPLSIALLVGNIWALGCSDADNGSNPQSQLNLGDYSVKIAGCEQYDYAGCDITAAMCQQNTFDLVKCVRQTPDGSMPPVQTLTASAYKAKLLSENSDTNPDDLARLETALVLLGLASPGDLTVTSQVDALVSIIAAFYSPDDKNVTVIVPDSGQSTNTQRDSTLTLAHEFVHALQDQEHDLNAFSSAQKSMLDGFLVEKSVVEGEARLYETVLRVAFDGIAQSAVNLPEYFQTAADYNYSQHTSDSPYLIAPLIFPYFYGARYDYLEGQVGGRSNIDGLFTAPPAGTLPYIVSQTSLVDTALVPVSDAAPTPVVGYTLFGDDVVGAWFTYQTVRTAGSSSTNQDAIAYAGDWRGDHLWVYSDGTASNEAIIWKTNWSSASAASSFAQRMGTAPKTISGLTSASRQAMTTGSVTLVVGVSGSSDLATWLAIAKTLSSQASAAASSSSSGSTGPTADAHVDLRRLLVSPLVHSP